MTLLSDLTRTAALLRAGWPIANLSRAKRAQERTEMTRHDPIAEPRPAHPRPRRHALHGERKIAPVPAAPDHIDDDARQFCAIETPAVVRAAATMTEAYRQLVDAQGRDAVSLDPAHGCAQADGIEAARRREAHLAALIDDALRDGANTGAAIAARLTALGVGVRL